MSIFRWIWNKLMEKKQDYLDYKEFDRNYWEMREQYDTRNMTPRQIWSLPGNKHLYELNKEQIDKEIYLSENPGVIV